MMPAMLRSNEAGERRRQAGHSPVKRGSVDGEAGAQSREAGDQLRQAWTNRDGEAGTIRDAASPGIFITYGKGNRKEIPRQRGLFERSV